MRAMLCTEWGGPDALTLQTIEPKSLGEGQVRVAIKAAGLNFADTLMIAGKYQDRPDFPFSPGLEAAGEITECGPGVIGLCFSEDLRHWEVGDPILAPNPCQPIRTSTRNRSAVSCADFAFSLSSRAILPCSRAEKNPMLVPTSPMHREVSNNVLAMTKPRLRATNFPAR